MQRVVRRRLLRLVAVVATGASIAVTLSCSGPTEINDPRLAGRIAQAAASSPSIHDGIANSPSDRVGCGVEILGRDRRPKPIYYVWLLCAGPPGQGNVSEPARVSVSGTTVTIDTPSDPNYVADLHRLFPDWIRGRVERQTNIATARLEREAREAQSATG